MSVTSAETVDFGHANTVWYLNREQILGGDRHPLAFPERPGSHGYYWHYVDDALSHSSDATPTAHELRPIDVSLDAWRTERSAAQVRRVIGPIVQPPMPKIDRSIVLQRWEGRVDYLTDGGFVARLMDLTGTGADEDAEFPLDEISPMDRPLVQEGAVFYWSVGYRDSASGQRTRESVVRFRRLPHWSKADRQEADRRVARWKERLTRP